MQREITMPRTEVSILLFVWYHPSHPAPGILNVAFVPWNDVDMNVENRLSSGLSNVDADVETVGMVAVGKDCFAAVDKQPHCPLFVNGKFKIIRHVAFGDNQRMSLADRITV